MPVCEFCNSTFPNNDRLNKHQAHAKRCHERLEERLLHQLSDHSDIRPYILALEAIDADADGAMGEGGVDHVNDESHGVNMELYDGSEHEAVDDFTPQFGASNESEANSDTTPPPQKRAKVMMEEVQDAEEGGGHHVLYEEKYPHPAGEPIQEERKPTQFDTMKNERQDKTPWYPFKSKGEWALAKWLVESGVTGARIDSFLKLEKVRIRLITSQPDADTTYRSRESSSFNLRTERNFSSSSIPCRLDRSFTVHPSIWSEIS
jgi:hypothetical protein